MKVIYQLFVRDINYWVVCKNGQFAVKRESEYPGKSAVIIFIGSYEQCKKYIENEWNSWQLAILT